jgi:hypothetical protein
MSNPTDLPGATYEDYLQWRREREADPPQDAISDRADQISNELSEQVAREQELSEQVAREMLPPPSLVDRSELEALQRMFVAQIHELAVRVVKCETLLGVKG